MYLLISILYLLPSSLSCSSPLPELLVHPHLYQEISQFVFFRERKHSVGKPALRDRERELASKHSLSFVTQVRYPYRNRSMEGFLYWPRTQATPLERKEARPYSPVPVRFGHGYHLSSLGNYSPLVLALATPAERMQKFRKTDSFVCTCIVL